MSVSTCDMDPDKTANKAVKPGYLKMSYPITSAVRLQRNQAEKQRRDRLNGYISELATLVPMVKNSTKPVDKVSVLRLTAAHMRLNISCLNPSRFKSNLSVLPSSFTSYLEVLEKNIGGFIVATTFTGTVVFCSKSVEDFLGFQNIDFMGQSIFTYVPNKESTHFQKKVNSVINHYKQDNSRKLSKSLVVHLQKRPLPRTNDISYQRVLIKISIHSNEIQNDPSKEARIQVKGKKMFKDFGTSALILMFIEPVTSYPRIPINQNDTYVTIHGIQGEIIEANHNISTITGYMPSDVLGKSAYEYIFGTDVPIAQFAQKAMFTSNDGRGIITYRLKTFNMKYIFLQSTGYLWKDSKNEIKRFICYNKWLSDEEGERELKKFQERFSPASCAAKQLEAQEKNLESKVACLNSHVEIDKTDNSAHSNGFQRESNDVSVSVAKRAKNAKSPPSELNGSLNENESCNGNVYHCNQDMDIKLEQYGLGNNYEMEKMEVCSYYQSTDLILENNVKQGKYKYGTLPQSLNSHGRMQDLSLIHYSNNLGKEGDGGSTYYNTRNGDNNYALYIEEKMLSYADAQLQNPYHTTKQMSSSVQPSTAHSYQELPSDHPLNFAMPSHMSVYKVTENGSYNNSMEIQDDQYNSNSSMEPFLKNNAKSLSYNQCNNKQVKINGVDCAHQNGDPYHLNSLGNDAYDNIQPSKIATYNNNFPPNDSMYDSIGKYGNGITNYDAFGFQKVVNPKNVVLSCAGSMDSSRVDNSNNSCVFTSLPSRGKWELLNNSYDCKNRNKSFNGEPMNSKDSRFRQDALETYSETVIRNGTFCEKQPIQSCLAIPSTNHECSFDDSRVNQELYNELDMFFENLPLTDTAQNKCSF